MNKYRVTVIGPQTQTQATRYGDYADGQPPMYHYHVDAPTALKAEGDALAMHQEARSGEPVIDCMACPIDSRRAAN